MLPTYNPYGAPTLFYAQPAVSFYSPAVSFAQTTLSYPQPATTYVQPTVTYAPPALSYAQPTTSYVHQSTYAQPPVTYAQTALFYPQETLFYVPQPVTSYAQQALYYSNTSHAQQPALSYAQPTVTYSQPPSFEGIMPSPYNSEGWRNAICEIGRVNWVGYDGVSRFGEFNPFNKIVLPKPQTQQQPPPASPPPASPPLSPTPPTLTLTSTSTSTPTPTPTPTQPPQQPPPSISLQPRESSPSTEYLDKLNNNFKLLRKLYYSKDLIYEDSLKLFNCITDLNRLMLDKFPNDYCYSVTVGDKLFRIPIKNEQDSSSSPLDNFPFLIYHLKKLVNPGEVDIKNIKSIKEISKMAEEYRSKSSAASR